jgi:transposase
MIQAPEGEHRIMRYELSDCECGVIKPMLPNKPRGIPRVDDRRVLNGIFWVLRSGAPWRDLPEIYVPRTCDVLFAIVSTQLPWPRNLRRILTSKNSGESSDGPRRTGRIAVH